MHDDTKFIEDRLERALRERLVAPIHRPVVPIDLTMWAVDGGQGEPVASEIALAQAYEPIALGDAWGPAWGTSWFHLTAQIPAEALGTPLEAIFNLGFGTHSPGFHAEGLVYLPSGLVVKGLNPRNQWIPVNEETAPGGRFDVYVEAAANPMVLGPDGFFSPTTLGEKFTAGPAPLYRLSRADINVFDAELWEYVQDLETLRELAKELGAGDPRKFEILRAAERSLDLIDLQNINASAPAARAALVEVLSRPASASAHRVSAIGHAHIDSAWLWPLRETMRKVSRTTANVVNLMDQDSGFQFASSQAQQLAWLKEQHPDLFERVKDHARRGAYVPVGGMWVESDTNMPGGEALARQFVHGKRFYLDEFGVETDIVWLPDSFGYSAALPQLVKLSASRWFLTQKISWSQTNAFPHHTFWWEGIDGSHVFTHFPPVDTYNSDLGGKELAHATRNFREKGAATRSLVPFGWGDGGGGPTREMLARAVRNADLEGAPRVQIESPEKFFSQAEAEYVNAPVWSGELYLEFHRAVYTSQVKNKQGNRRSEHLLREVELWSATAAVRTGFAYPHAELDRIWKQVLLLQFHDILPGTSIAWVHREAADTYAALAAELGQLLAAAQQALAGDPAAGSEVTFNASPFGRRGVPALGATVSTRDKEPVIATARADAEGLLLDNGILRVSVDERGLVTSIIDLRVNREVLAAGQAGNLLQLHADFPNMWDAWDIEASYRNTVTDLTMTDVVELSGPNAVHVRRSFGASTVDQTLTLAPGADRLDIETTVDWQEVEKLLKVSFPIDVHADRSASEIQYGHVFRPTHTNTSWDAAKFEICAHRWIHVAEPGYGVAIANDSTYGHDVVRSADEKGRTTTTVRLSLMRAPRYPDPATDQGVHTLSYSIVPGVDVIASAKAGYELNLPERRVPGSAEVAPLVTVDNEHVVVESVKMADDASGDVVVRLYEAAGGRARASLTAGFPVVGVEETDLLERAIEPDALQGVDAGIAQLALRPFQIVTLRLTRS